MTDDRKQDLIDAKTVRLDHLLGVYSVGSGDWPWVKEYDNLIDQPDTRNLLDLIRTEGIREPILLGADGRIWDGHHRIVIAMHLGLDSVPVEFASVVPEEPEWGWQWCYVEKWADHSGVYERVTFDTLKKARRYLRDNAERLAALNAQATEDDRVVASIEKRRVTEPGPWLSVEQEGESNG